MLIPLVVDASLARARQPAPRGLGPAGTPTAGRRGASRLLLVLLALLAGLLLGRALAPPAAAATFTPLDVQLLASVRATSPGLPGPAFADDVKQIEDGVLDGRVRAARLLEANRIGFGGTLFPKPVNPNLGLFASAETRGDGSYGVGASGIAFGTSEWRGRSIFEYRLRNDGPAPDFMQYRFDIPRMEASLAGFRDLEAVAQARGYIKVEDEDGELVRNASIFDFRLRQYTDPATPLFPFRTEWSPDLDEVLASTGLEIDYGVQQIGSYDVSTLTLPGFSVSVGVGDIAPGHTVTFGIEGIADLLVGPGGGEQGGQALVGDPFEVALGGGPLLQWLLDDDPAPGPIVGPPPGPVVTPAPIPLPPGALFLVGALGALAGVRRLRDRG